MAHSHIWCSRWPAITSTPSVNSYWLWCHYTLSSLRSSAISSLMTMIHSVWSDYSIYTPANDREWNSERMIAAYVGATVSCPNLRIVQFHTHSCVVHLCCVHCQDQACHSSSALGSGMGRRTRPKKSYTVPKSSILSMITGSLFFLYRLVYAKPGVTYPFSPWFNLSAFLLTFY